MISKLAKSIAHFFVIKNIVEKPEEVIYAYGMELLISDVLNSIFVLLIALISHTLPAVIIFLAVFMSLRQSVGGYHANSHFSCMLTLIIVMLIFSYGICNISDSLIWLFDIVFVSLSLPVIFSIAPVPHPNKPMSEEKGVILKRKSRVLVLLLSMCVAVLMIFQINKFSLYVSSGILLSSTAALLGYLTNRSTHE